MFRYKLFLLHQQGGLDAGIGRIRALLDCAEAADDRLDWLGGGDRDGILNGAIMLHQVTLLRRLTTRSERSASALVSMKQA
jgi:hypothetical protein